MSFHPASRGAGARSGVAAVLAGGATDDVADSLTGRDRSHPAIATTTHTMPIAAPTTERMPGKMPSVAKRLVALALHPVALAVVIVTVTPGEVLSWSALVDIE